MPFYQQAILAIITGMLTGGGYIAWLRYRENAPLTWAKAREVNNIIADNVTNKWKEIAKDYEARLLKAEQKIETLQTSLDEYKEKSYKQEMRIAELEKLNAK